MKLHMPHAKAPHAQSRWIGGYINVEYCPRPLVFLKVHVAIREGEGGAGGEGGRDRGTEGGDEGEGGRDGRTDGTEGGRDRGREGWRDGGRKEGRNIYCTITTFPLARLRTSATCVMEETAACVYK